MQKTLERRRVCGGPNGVLARGAGTNVYQGMLNVNAPHGTASRKLISIADSAHTLVHGATLSGAQIAGGFLVAPVLTGNMSVTLPSAADVALALGMTLPCAGAFMYIEFDNSANLASQYTITVNNSATIRITGSTTLVIGGGVIASRCLMFSVTGVGSFSAMLEATVTNPMTTPGDIITAGTAGAPSRLAAGTNGQVLAVVSGVPAWNSALTLNSLQITVFPTATNPAPYGIRWVDNPSSYFYDSSVTNSNWYGVALPKAGTDAPCSDNQHNTSPVGPLALNNGYDLANVANCYVIVPPGTRSFRFSGYAALGGGIRTSSYFSILWGTISDTPSISSNSTGVSVTLMSPPFPDGSMLLMHDQGSGIGAEFGPNLAIIGGWRQSASLPNYTNVMISEAYSSNIIAVRVL